MAVIKIDRFSGIAPRTHPTLLQDGMAVTAHNLRLKNGKIVPIREPSMADSVRVHLENGLASIGQAMSMHAWKQNGGNLEILAFPGMTWCARGNVADDPNSRVIVSGETGVNFVDADFKSWKNSPQIYLMDDSVGKVIHPICKNPLPAPKVSRSSIGSLESESSIVNKGYRTVNEINGWTAASNGLARGWVVISSDYGTISLGDIGVQYNSKLYFDGTVWKFYDDVEFDTGTRYTFFFWTWVDKYGYESPVSSQSLVQENGSWVEKDLEYNDGDSIRIQAPIASDVPYDADKIRVYKVVTGTETGRIQFLAEFAASTVISQGCLFTVKDEDAGEVISIIEAPQPDLKNVIRVFGGGAFYAGFSASNPKSVCFSEIDLPYSWPVAYRYDVDDEIVALATTSNTVYALTDGYPYVLNGTAPESMTVTPLAGPAACVSARSVCVFENSVYYASPVGVCIIYNNSDEGTVVKNLTDKIWTKEQWSALNPSSCVIRQYDGALHCFFDDGETKRSYIVDITDGTVTTVDDHATCVCTDNANDAMYFVRSV